MLSKSEICRAETLKYIEMVKDNPPSVAEMKSDLLGRYCMAIESANATNHSSRMHIPQELPFSEIALLVATFNNVIRLDWTGNRDVHYTPMIYQTDGENEGLYTQDEADFYKIISEYNYLIKYKEFKAIMDMLRIIAPIKTINNNPDLIAVNNGIFDYKNKVLLPFSPDMVFTTKSRVNYNPEAVNPIIHNDVDGTDWDVESWVAELSDNPEVVALLWQVIGAIIRPNVSWDKAILFYSEKGNNGKGTLCELMRNLCGKGVWASIALDAFGEAFRLESLVKTTAIITDENDVKCFTKSASVLKAVITGDSIQLNCKFKSPITFRFKGLMVQCVNDLPKFSDKSESIYRRFIIIPFEKCYSRCERKYIKNDYLNRQDVLEYVLHKVLNTNYYSFDVPLCCETFLNKYKSYNDSVRAFVDEVFPELVWDFIPYQFLYDLYRSWYAKNCPSGLIESKQSFNKDIRHIFADSREWVLKDTAYPVGDKMNQSEMLIIEYDLRAWMNPNYRGQNRTLICQPMLKQSYTGLLRK